MKDNKKIALNFGDESVLEDSFNRYFYDLYHFAIMMVQDEQLAEELVHDVFLKLWDKKRNIDVSVSIKGYLLTAVKNTCLNYLKKSQPKFVDESEIDFGLEIPAEGDVELKRLIRKGIYSLPEKCRAIFILSRQFGMSYQEISKILDISKNTVENQMVIALRKLKVYLKSNPNFIFFLFL